MNLLHLRFFSKKSKLLSCDISAYFYFQFWIFTIFWHEIMNSGITLACFKYFLNVNLKIFLEGFNIADQTSRLPTTFRILFSKKLCAQSTPWICQCKVIFDSICFVPIAHLPSGKSILKMWKKRFRSTC